jgi:hypothetical protein
MQIKVLGTCCSVCNATYAAVSQAAEEIDPAIVVEQVGDVMQIIHYGVIQTPAVIINEKIVSAGKHLSVTDAKKLLKDYEN